MNLVKYLEKKTVLRFESQNYRFDLELFSHFGYGKDHLSRLDIYGDFHDYITVYIQYIDDHFDWLNFFGIYGSRDSPINSIISNALTDEVKTYFDKMIKLQAFS